MDEDAPAEKERIYDDVKTEDMPKEMAMPTPDGRLFASTAELRVDYEETANLARDAKILKHSVAEIVPGLSGSGTHTSNEEGSTSVASGVPNAGVKSSPA